MSVLPLQGKRVLVTAGATMEAIDPVRYITNRSSGKQGYAIATSLRALGAEVILVSGQATAPLPEGVTIIKVASADQMLHACLHNLPVDIAVCVAAVCDWKMPLAANQKLKKKLNENSLTLTLVKTPDILHAVATHPQRPGLVIGFAAETQDMLENAKAKRMVKQCDWIVANNVAHGTGVLGGDYNQFTIITDTQVITLDRMSKQQSADALSQLIVQTITP